MKPFLIHVLASVLVFVVGYVIVHSLFVLCGSGEKQSWPLLIAEAAATGATFGVIDYLYRKYKKK